MLVFIHFLSRARESGRGGTTRPGCNGERGSGVPWDNRRHHPCFPDPLILVPHRQTLIDVIFTLDTRPSFCNLLCSVPVSFPSNLISALSHLLDTFAVNNAVTIMRQSTVFIIYDIKFIRYSMSNKATSCRSFFSKQFQSKNSFRNV